MSQQNPHSDTDLPQEEKYESLKVNVSAIAKWTVAFGISVILIFVFLGFLLNYYMGEEELLVEIPRLLQDRPPAPRVDVNQPEQLQELRAREKAILNSYGWVNREEDIARIPIGRAMDLYLEKGVSVRKGNEEVDTETQRQTE